MNQESFNTGESNTKDNLTRQTVISKKCSLSKTKAAAILGVTLEHLSRVLHGHRQSKSLMDRYNNLMRSHVEDQWKPKAPTI